ncbi:G-protein coupled receptor 151 [Tachyglossus aculeatus]|uniref:G-protein coupled receptor 151 n=1 Tax=Tachyglossus aculeatus TaxID=9261 RepID=UPI0018F6F4E7|nr:G-protein coupled receptor 151 [Tachyglossus aculeatus]
MNTSRPQFRFSGGYQPLDSLEWRRVIPALLAVICLLGFAGNLCVICTLLYGARKKKPSMIHSLILNLSAADLSLLLFSAPLRAAAYSRGAWNLSWFVCKSADWFAHACMVAKSLTMAAVAKVCFLYAGNPARQGHLNQGTLWAVVLAIWGTAALLPLPEWFFSTFRREAGVGVCVTDVPAPAREFVYVFGKLYPLLAFGFPLLFSGFYFRKAYGRCRRRGTKTQNLRNQVRSRRLTVMLLSVTVTSAILWLPEWAAWLWVWNLGEGSPPPPQGLIALCQASMFAISAADPLIFLAMSEEFREGCGSLWKWLTPRRALPGPGSPAAAQAGQPQVLPDAGPPPDSRPPDSEGGKPHSLPEEESLEKKENPVLPDVEQFWHERDSVPSAQDNDPIPWEHGEQETAGCEK